MTPRERYLAKLAHRHGGAVVATATFLLYWLAVTLDRTEVADVRRGLFFFAMCEWAAYVWTMTEGEKDQ